MPIKRLPAIDEAELRRFIKTVAFSRAVSDLRAGYPQVRRQYANAVLTTQWDTAPDAPRQVIFREAHDPYVLDCSCNDYALEQQCPHVNAAALAWVRAPESFTLVEEDFDLEAFFEALEYGDDDDGELFDLFGDDNGVLDLNALAAQLLGGPAQGPGEAAPPPPAPVTIEREAAGATRAWLRLKPSGLEVNAQRAALEHLNVNQLRSVAQQRGVPVSGTKRDPILNTLAEALSRPEVVAAAWAALSPAARLVLTALPFVSAPVGTTLEHLRAALGVFNADLLPQLKAALQELSDTGLIVTTPYGYYTSVDGLQNALPPDPAVLRPYPEADNLRVAAAGGAADFATLSARLLLALHAGADTLRARPAPAPHPLEKTLPGLAKGWPYLPGELEAVAKQKSPAQAVNKYAFSIPPAPPLLTEAAQVTLSQQLPIPPDQLDFALRLLVGLGLMRLPPGGAPQVDPAALVSYLGAPPLGHVIALFTAYVLNTGWTEFDLAAAHHPGLLLAHPGRLPNYGLAELLADLVSVRSALLSLLRRAPAGQWFDVPSIVLRAHGLNLLGTFWPAQSPAAAYKNGQPLEARKVNEWREFYGAYVEAVLTGPLHWLGLVDLGYQGDRLAAFRFTDLGAFLTGQRWELSVPVALDAGPRLTFPPEGTLRLQPLGASSELVALLNLLGQVQIGPDGALDYTLTAASVSAAFQAGWESERLLATLAEAAGAPVPQQLAARLREWEARYGEVQLYQALALVELADDYALTELLAATSLARILLFRFSPRLIAVRPEGLDAWRAELVAKGYTPRTEA